MTSPPIIVNNNYYLLDINFWLYNRFFRNTWLKASKNLKKELLRFYKIRSVNNIFDTFTEMNSSLFQLDYYINFSAENFKFMMHFHKLSDNFKGYKFIGLLQFDKIYHQTKQTLNLNSKKILFIDQPLAEQNILGWNFSYKKNYKNLNKLLS